MQKSFNFVNSVSNYYNFYEKCIPWLDQIFNFKYEWGTVLSNLFLIPKMWLKWIFEEAIQMGISSAPATCSSGEKWSQT